jgi:Holliday junction resolvase RusA-like endonuclease
VSIQFTVFGKPETKGSTRAFVYTDKATGKPRAAITNDNARAKPWQQQIAGAAFDLAGEMLFGPVELTLDFFIAKPKSAKKSIWAPAVRPDVSKYVRVAEDALSGILYKDDGQIVRLVATKQYGLPERVEIKLEALTLETGNSAVPKAVIPPLTKPAETVLNLFEKG